MNANVYINIAVPEPLDWDETVEIVFTKEDAGLYRLLQEGLKQEQVREEAQPKEKPETRGRTTWASERVRQRLL